MCPHGMFARGAASIVGPRHDDACLLETWLVQYEGWIGNIAVIKIPKIAKKPSPPVALCGDQPLLGNDHVGVDVADIQGNGRSGDGREWIQRPPTSRGSAMLPAIADAAAVAGLARWVLAPLPCRPSKLRLEVDTQRSPAATRSEFIPIHIEHPDSRH